MVGGWLEIERGDEPVVVYLYTQRGRWGGWVARSYARGWGGSKSCTFTQKGNGVMRGRLVIERGDGPIVVYLYTQRGRWGGRVAREKMLRPWSQQARQLSPRRGMVAHLGNRGCCVHTHTGNLSVARDP